MDLEALYHALHTIIGEETEDRFARYKNTRYRILALCYEIRHAIMGDRELQFVENGMQPDTMKRHAVITHNKNVYMSFQVLWPEALFTMLLLNDYTNDYEKNKQRQLFWDRSIATVRMYQTAIAACLTSLLNEANYKRTMNLMNDRYSWYGDYCTQYVDLLNVRFVKMDPEKRLKNISVMAKRLVEKPAEYTTLQSEVEASARHHGCSVLDITLKDTEIPEGMDW
jgi:hypothetical protein